MASCYSMPRTSWLSAEDLGNGGLPRMVQDSAEDTKVTISGVPLTLYGRSVRRASLSGVDASVELNSATSVQYRIKRALLLAGNVEDVLAVLERSFSEFDGFHCTLAVHRLARFGRAARASCILGHLQWPALLARLQGAIHTGEPRHLASTAWALANLQVRDVLMLDSIADRCVQRAGGRWDAMSLSLVLQSFAVLGAHHRDLADSVAAQVQRELSSAWPPGDVARVVWSFARLLRRDDGFFRGASCKALARLPEFSPTTLVQTIWAFATVAPASVTSHFFPYAAEAMQGPGLMDHTAAHFAMVSWSFAAVLFRPVPLLEAIGDQVTLRSEQLNSQDITMIAWSYATLLAPQRRVFESLAAAAVRTIRAFNVQDLSNTAWAFATAGEYSINLLDAIAEESCSRPNDFNCQHVAMLIWAFVTARHRHDRLFAVIGGLARVDLGSWHSAKLLAYALAGLPKLRSDLGSHAATMRVAAQLVDALRERIRKGEGEPDDAHSVHDAVFPWLASSAEGCEPEGWLEVDALMVQQRKGLQAVMCSPVCDAILAIKWWVYDERVVREYQCAVQALGLRGLGSAHTLVFLQGLGVQRAAAQEELAARAAATRVESMALARGAEGQAQDAGRGERANWCFWRASVAACACAVGRHSGTHIQAMQERQCVAEGGRLQSSTVVGYREDCGGLVAVKLSHDHVSHRAWDCEFRAMARTAAAARALLAGMPVAKAQALLDFGAADEPPPQEGADVATLTPQERLALEASVEGRLEIYMTEVPCLSCIGAMAQFRRRFPRISFEVAWDGMPADNRI